MAFKTEDITVKQGDFGYRLSLPLKDASGNARDMTGYSAKLKVWKPNIPGTLIINGDCDWTDQSGGIAYYDVQDEDFPNIARYLYEVEVTKTGAKESARSGNLIVEESP